MAVNYTYPAIISFDDDGIGVEFPDIPGCYSCPESKDDILPQASEALSLHLYNMEEDGDEIPAPSDILSIPHKAGQAVIFVPADTNRVRAHQSRKTTNIMVTIPEKLAYDARDSGINFSQLIQKALMRELGIRQNRKR